MAMTFKAIKKNENDQRISTGLPSLDCRLHGGFPVKSLTMIQGMTPEYAPCSLADHFLDFEFCKKTNTPFTKEFILHWARFLVCVDITPILVVSQELHDFLFRGMFADLWDHEADRPMGVICLTYPHTWSNGYLSTMDRLERFIRAIHEGSEKVGADPPPILFPEFSNWICESSWLAVQSNPDSPRRPIIEDLKRHRRLSREQMARKLGSLRQLVRETNSRIILGGPAVYPVDEEHDDPRGCHPVYLARQLMGSKAWRHLDCVAVIEKPRDHERRGRRQAMIVGGGRWFFGTHDRHAHVAKCLWDPPEWKWLAEQLPLLRRAGLQWRYRKGLGTLWDEEDAKSCRRNPKRKNA